MADKQPKKVSPSKYNRGWTAPAGWKPSGADVAVRNMAEKLAADKIAYIQSKDYADRLAMQGEPDISTVVGNRVEALKNTEYFSYTRTLPFY
jgi:hypothetical protein